MASQAKTEELQLLTGMETPKTSLPEYQIVGRPAFACVSFDLKDGETITTDAGSLLWTDSTTSVRTHLAGGLCASYLRTCSGESCCFNSYTGPGNVTLAMPEPGDMFPFAVTPDHGWVITAQSYIAGTPNVDVSTRFSGCVACCCSGEGLFLTKVTVPSESGVFFAGGYGEIVRHDIPEGKTLVVDTGLFFAAREDVSINVRFLGGCYSCICGGEGVVMSFTGPGVIYTQSRDPEIFRRIQAFGQVSDALSQAAEAASKAQQ